MKIHPFKNESESLDIGEATIENHENQVNIYGRLSITRDKSGLDMALTLQALMNDIVSALQAENLPDAITVIAPTKGANPFA